MASFASHISTALKLIPVHVREKKTKRITYLSAICKGDAMSAQFFFLLPMPSINYQTHFNETTIFLIVSTLALDADCSVVLWSAD